MILWSKSSIDPLFNSRYDGKEYVRIHDAREWRGPEKKGEERRYIGGQALRVAFVEVDEKLSKLFDRLMLRYCRVKGSFTK